MNGMGGYVGIWAKKEYFAYVGFLVVGIKISTLIGGTHVCNAEYAKLLWLDVLRCCRQT